MHPTDIQTFLVAFLLWWYMPQTIFPPAGIYAIDVTLPVDTRRDFTSQTINNTNTADNVLETDHFTDNYVDNIRSPVIDIANLSTILDNDLTDLLDVPVCSDLNYEPFKYIENNNYFMCDGIDPDSNIHNKISVQAVDSLYCTESEFKEHFEFKQKGSSNFSLVHFNCRSMARNFDKLKDSVKGLDFPFDVIAVSETWLKDNDTSSSYSIDGYSSFQCSRLNKTGGGVALYINETLQPNYLPNKSKCIDNCAEIVTVEVTLATGKRVLVSCAYRAPKHKCRHFE